MTLRPLALAGLIAALGLAGCGKLGALERPGPMFGHASGADAGSEPTQTVRTIDPRNRDSDPAPLRSTPLDPNPTEMAPQGVLPDPYANPR